MTRWHAVGAALLLRAIVVICEPPPPEPELFYGYVESLHSYGDSHHFTLRHRGVRHDVFYTGELPKTVCNGQDTWIDGFVENSLVLATDVHGPGCTKGVECRQWACLPVDKRPPECQPKNYQ